MNTASKNQTKETSEAVEQFTNASWTYAHKHLWNNYPFSLKEIQSAKKYIRTYFEEIIPALFSEYALEKHYEFNIRVILTAMYVKRKNGRYVNHPVIWFNPDNKFGFAGTKEWYLKEMERDQYKNIRFINDQGALIKSVA